MYRHLSVERFVQLGLMAVLVLTLGNFSQKAFAGHMNGPNQTCFSAGSNKNCRANFMQDQWMYIKLEDQYTSLPCNRGGWGYGTEPGRAAWSAAAGPQVLH